MGKCQIREVSNGLERGRDDDGITRSENLHKSLLLEKGEVEGQGGWSA